MTRFEKKIEIEQLGLNENLEKLKISIYSNEMIVVKIESYILYISFNDNFDCFTLCSDT